jgi:sugar-specific transcriptional regulator TrmB
MVDTSPREALAAFGFSDKEIKVYLSCLELGTATANSISGKAYLNRSTTYDILKNFLERGIASKVNMNNTTYFEITTPSKLISTLEEKKEKIRNALKSFEILQQRTITKPSVQVFQGSEGFKTVLTDILNTKKPVDVISTSKIFEIMRYYFPHYIKNRAGLGIKTRVIQEYSKQTLGLKKTDKKENRETRIIKNWNTNTMKFIYGDKIAVIKLVEEDIISVLIKDQIMTEDEKKIFEILWKTAR